MVDDEELLELVEMEVRELLSSMNLMVMNTPIDSRFSSWCT
jgi:translation elongation factor EF-Tu-like GTPase